MRYFILALAAVLMAGCKTSKSVTQERTEKRDSVRVEYRERVVFVPDTIFLEVPKQSAERVVRDSVSHLENEYAYSDARILIDGSLFHALSTKPQKKPIQTMQKIVTRDSIVYVDRWRSKDKVVKIEKQLSWLQKAQIWLCRSVVLTWILFFAIQIIRTIVRKLTKH